MLKKLLKTSILLFIFFSFPLYAQENSQTENQNLENQTEITDDFKNKMESSSEISMADSFGEQKLSTGKDWSTVKALVGMVFVLLVVIGLIYAFSYFVKRSIKHSDTDDPFLRQVSKVTLSPGKSVQIVTVLNHAYLIGVSDNSINLIGEIDDKELVDSMNLYADKNNNEKKPRTFADVLDIFMPHGPRSADVYGSSSRNATDILKRQRERFNGENRE